MHRLPEVDPSPTEQPDHGPQELVISMREKLKETQQYASRRPWEKWCIYQMPQRLRDVTNNGKSYLPQTVSIGPYHLGSERVRDMDHYKWLALHQILERTGQDLNLYIDSIKQVEKQARAYYQQEVAHLSSDRFVEMMILDACFILELFRCYQRTPAMSNPVFSNQRIVGNILLDMVMLENQIPLFVIDRTLRVFIAGNPGEHQRDQAMDLVLNLFNAEWLTGKPMSRLEFNELKISLEQEECLHVLDVFRRSLLYAGTKQWEVQSQGFQWRVCDKLVPGCLKLWLHRSPKRIFWSGCIHRVTLLKEGGVKFRRRNSNCFWDIKFKKGILEIPPIWIQDSTMTILLNVAAFEHCHLKISEAVIASYVVFKECLIKSPKDVNHLQRHGIIQNFLGDDAEVVDMFKSISKEMLVDARAGNYAQLTDQVNAFYNKHAYYNKRKNRWRASLIHNYFNNPWTIISLVAAVILLILTAIQSFYAVFAYYRPNS